MELVEKAIFGRCVFEYFLDRKPVEEYKDEKHNVTCVIAQSEKHDYAVFITAGASRRENFNPLEMRIMVDAKILKDEKGIELIKKWLSSLLDTDLPTKEDYKIFYFDEEFKKHFNKAGCVFMMSNCGEPLFYSAKTTTEVWGEAFADDGFFMTYPVFLSEEEIKEFLESEDDEDKYYYVQDKDDDEDDWLLKY